jgi:hypothetical protein
MHCVTPVAHYAAFGSNRVSSLRVVHNIILLNRGDGRVLLAEVKLVKNINE